MLAACANNIAHGEHRPPPMRILSGSAESDSKYASLPKFNGDFSVQRCIYDKIFMKIRSVFFSETCRTKSGKTPYLAEANYLQNLLSLSCQFLVKLLEVPVSSLT